MYALNFYSPLFIDQLRNGQTPTHARLGISVSDKGSSTDPTENGLITGAGVEDVTMELALFDECRNFGLGLVDAPRRTKTRELRSRLTVGRIKEIFCTHTSRTINRVDICQYH